MDALFPHATRRRLGYDSLVKAIAFLLPRELSADELFTRRIVTRIKAPRPLEFKPEKNPVASIIIPVCNKWQFTYLCLHSILINTAQVAYEVIVVDNGSRDKTHALLGKVKHITHIRLARNEGFSVACNTGAQVAHGDYLVFLNNDTLVTKGWLYALLQVFQDDIGVGLVGSKLIRPGNKLKEAGGIVWKNGDACNYGASGNPQSYAYNYRKEVDYCSAASVMVAKQVFNSVGGFDMKFSPAYFEDTDLAFKLRQKGFKVIYQPCSAVLHFEGITGGRDCKKGYKRFQEKHKETFFSQWRDVIVQEQCDQSEGPFRARDRSQHKDIMLFIDQTIPRYDKDAGSFITFRYLQLFKELGFKIIFWPQDLLVRQPYCADLQQMGIEVVYGKVSFDEFIATHGRFIDVAVVSRPEVAAVFLDPLQRNSKAKIAYVPHDLHYVREHGHGLFDFKRNSASEWRALKALEKRIMGRVNVSLFFSDKETNMARKEFPGIKAEQINWIQEVSVRESKISPFDERAGILFLGWFGHLPNVDSLRWFHDDILPGIYNKIPNVVTTVIGDDIPDDIQRFASKLFLFQGALNEEELTNCFSKARLFVAPLRFGAGIKGKIAKSMSYGVPVVTTSIGAEGMGLIDGENAFIADSNDEFAQKLVELYCNKTVWQKFSQQSMALIKERYSKDSARKKIEKIFRGYGILDEDNRGN